MIPVSPVYCNKKSSQSLPIVFFVSNKSLVIEMVFAESALDTVTPAEYPNGFAVEELCE